MQYSLNAGNNQSVGTQPDDLLLVKVSLPTVTCNSDLIIYMFLLNKETHLGGYLGLTLHATNHQSMDFTIYKQFI